MVIPLQFPLQCLDVILQGTYLPLPSQAALDDGIGRGGNGTITNIYFKGKEFAVKKVSGAVCMHSPNYTAAQ